MYILNIKNIIRYFAGLLSIRIFKNKERCGIYCNFRGGAATGGPDRFIHNFKNAERIEKKVVIKRWGMNNCQSALVFTCAWGETFVKLCKENAIKTVLRVDGFYVPDDINESDYLMKAKMRNYINNRIAYDLENFDHVIYQSHFSKSICDEYLYERNTEYTIVYNGVNLSHFKMKEKIKRSDTIRIVVLGKHYPKHLKLAMDIFNEILKRKKAQLTIIGPMRDGSDTVDKHIEGYKDKIDHNGTIECKGTVSFDDLPEVLNKEDVLLHVKVGDWCPNAVIEGMACGLPVVCPSWGGTKELIGDAGISVDGPRWRDSEQLIKGMAEAVLEIHYELDEYRKKARGHVEKSHNMQQVSKKYMDILSNKQLNNETK